MDSFVKSAIKEELHSFALLLSMGLVVGYLIENIKLGLLLALSIYIFFHFQQAWKALTWLSKGKLKNAPSTYGLWGAFIQQAVKSEIKTQKIKKRFRAVLRHSNDVLAAMPDALVILDEFGGVEWFNSSARHILQMNKGQDTGAHITRCINEKTFSHYYNKRNYEHSTTIASPFDGDISLNIRIARYGNKKQLLSARDVTRMRQLEGVRSLFVANVSHELRTPLTVISGYLELLASNKEEAVSDELLALRPVFKQMNQQTDRMTGLLDDLLTLSNLENQQVLATSAETVCIAAMIKDIHSEAQVLSREKNHTIRCDVDENLAITGHANEIHSAFTNLVTNALRYTPEGGEIKILWKKENQTAHFSVCDNGIGIEQQHITRLTERFYRVDKGRSRNTGGTGLGLAIVKHILYKHDATLEIKSELEKGSCFTCVFPENRTEYCES